MHIPLVADPRFGSEFRNVVNADFDQVPGSEAHRRTGIILWGRGDSRFLFLSRNPTTRRQRDYQTNAKGKRTPSRANVISHFQRSLAWLAWLTGGRFKA